MSKQLFEITNPSDTVTFYADSFELAVALNLMCSEGRFGVDEIDTDRSLPPMLGQLGGMAALDRWCFANFGKKTNEFIDQVCKDFTHQQMAESLLTTATVESGLRRLYDSDFELAPDKDEFFYQWDDEHRSSLSKIAAHFYEQGKRIMSKDLVEESA